jgi:hypothetical protein
VILIVKPSSIAEATERSETERRVRFVIANHIVSREFDHADSLALIGKTDWRHIDASDLGTSGHVSCAEVFDSELCHDALHEIGVAYVIPELKRAFVHEAHVYPDRRLVVVKVLIILGMTNRRTLIKRVRVPSVTIRTNPSAGRISRAPFTRCGPIPFSVGRISEILMFFVSGHRLGLQNRGFVFGHPQVDKLSDIASNVNCRMHRTREIAEKSVSF